MIDNHPKGRPIETHCFYCGGEIDRQGDPIADEGRHRDQVIFRNLAWSFRENPMKTMVLLYRVTDAAMTLDDIANAITSIVANVHNRGLRVSKQAIMHQINRICDDFADGSIKGILKPRKGRHEHKGS